MPLTIAQCSSCDAPIIWAITSKTGKRIPLDAQRRDDGNVVLVGVSPQGVPVAHVFRPADLEAARRFGRLSLFYPHHASCPEGDEWRRTQAKGAT